VAMGVAKVGGGPRGPGTPNPPVITFSKDEVVFKVYCTQLLFMHIRDGSPPGSLRPVGLGFQVLGLGLGLSVLGLGLGLSVLGLGNCP